MLMLDDEQQRVADAELIHAIVTVSGLRASCAPRAVLPPTAAAASTAAAIPAATGRLSFVFRVIVPRTDRTPASRSGISVRACAQCLRLRRRAAAPARGRCRKRRVGVRVVKRRARNPRRREAQTHCFRAGPLLRSRRRSSKRSRTRTRRSRYSHGERAPCGTSSMLRSWRFSLPFLEAVDMAVVSSPAQRLRDRAIPNPTPSPLLARRAGVAWLERHERGVSSRAARQQRPRVAARARRDRSQQPLRGRDRACVLRHRQFRATGIAAARPDGGRWTGAGPTSLRSRRRFVQFCEHRPRPFCRDDIPFLFVQPQRFLGLADASLMRPASRSTSARARWTVPRKSRCSVESASATASRASFSAGFRSPPRASTFARTDRQRYCDIRSSGAAARSPSFV